jgi:membrane protease YdiL (CAAX protease family)
VQLADHILFFLLGLLLPAMLFFSARKRRHEESPRWSTQMKIALYYGNGALLWGLTAMIIIVWYFSGRPLIDLGLGWGDFPYDLGAVLVLSAFIGLYLFDVYLEAGSPERREATRRDFHRLGFLPANAREFLHFLFLAVTAGVCEEVIYRGFMISYLTDVLGPSPLGQVSALVVPAVAFGLGHFYQGGRAVMKIVLMAILFGFFFMKSWTLWPLMLLHTAVDVLGGVLSWSLLGRED